MATKKIDDEDRIFYYLSVADLQEVAGQLLERELTPEEIKLVEDRVADFIPWFDAIEMAIEEKIGFDDETVDDDENEEAE